jgi:type I restriction enzyme S subunit
MSWDEVLIKDVAKIVGGYSFKSKDFTTTGEVPVIKIKSLKKEKIVIDNDNYIDKSFLELDKKYHINYNDILIALTGSHITLPSSAVGRVAKSQHKEILLLNQRVGKFVVDPNLCYHDFLFYILISDYFFQSVGLRAQGAASQANISGNDVGSIKINLPPLKTQKRIADILSAYDDLIENNLKRIKLLEQAAQNIYKEWFVNLRFPGHENTPVNEETGLPQGWGNGIVSDLCEVKSGFAFKSKHWKKEGNPVMKIKNINNNTVDIDNSDFVDNDVAGLAKKYELFPGDVIIAMTGATVGKVGLIPKIGKRIYLNQRVGLFRPLTEENDNIALVFSFFLTDDSQQQVLNFAQGAAQPNISGSEIGNIKLNIADSKVLSLFNKMIKPSFQLVQSLYGQNQKLKAARDILLPRLMNRTIEV